MSLILIKAVCGTVTDGRRMLTTVTAIARDVRGVFRQATRRPLYAAAVVGTLTLGIAATSVAYGLATAVLWRPLPFRDADRLVFVWEASERDGRREMFRVTSGRFAEWRQQVARLRVDGPLRRCRLLPGGR